MMKSKLFDKVKYFAFRLIPEKWRFGTLTWILRTWYKPPMLVSPWSKQAIIKALVILPEDPVEAFHQIPNYLQLATHFSNTSFFLCCTGKVGTLFRHIQPNATFFEYDTSQRFLFSRQFKEWGKLFSKEEFDLCLILEREPDISLLYLAGKTAAAVRAGYSEAGGEFPFLNIHVNPSPEQRNRTEQNKAMARALGASGSIKVNWSIAKETEEELSHMFRERQISSGAGLVGIDGGLFLRSFGTDWTEMLCTRLRENSSVSYYFFVEDEPDEGVSPSLTSFGFPVFSDFSPPRCIALISRSAGIISGKSVFFELANMLGRPVVGVFDENQCALYCRQSALTKAVIYSGEPDRSVVEQIVVFVNSLGTPRKA